MISLSFKYFENSDLNEIVEKKAVTVARALAPKTKVHATAKGSAKGQATITVEMANAAVRNAKIQAKIPAIFNVALKDSELVKYSFSNSLNFLKNFHKLDFEASFSSLSNKNHLVIK